MSTSAFSIGDEFLESIRGMLQAEQLSTLVIIALALAGAWLIARLSHTHLDRRLVEAAAMPSNKVAVDALRFSLVGLRRLVFPLAALALVWIGSVASQFLGRATRADSRALHLSMVLLGAMALIALIAYVLRRVFSRSAWLASFERLLALGVWLAVALHITGLATPIIDWLQGNYLPIGRGQVSLYALISGGLLIGAVLLFTLWIGSFVEARLMRAQRLDASVRAMLVRSLRAVLVTFAVLLALSFAGIDLTVLSVFGGALGVGIGLALQRVVANYVAGFVILLDRSLRIGDLITVDKICGIVTQISARYSVVRSLDGNEAIVPNELMVAQTVINHSFSDRRVAVSVKLTVAFNADVTAAMRLMTEAAVAQKRVLVQPAPLTQLTGFVPHGVELQVGFWIGDPENSREKVQAEVALAIFERFRAAGIEFPYPRYDIRLMDQKHVASEHPQKLIDG